VLDICCGTGDLVMALQRACRGRFSARISAIPCWWRRAKRRRAGMRRAAVRIRRAAPAGRDASLDLITVAFGFRNLANYEDGLREMRRVLRPGGMAAILEFSQPPNAVFGAVYGFYSRRVLPWIGGLLTGSRDAYRYLPESIRKFPPRRSWPKICAAPASPR
jgi:demethylmenaquinone methyltransferase / 2-methoxy-6-polyprenyl-1,4-benzoquinol methylase